MANGTVTVDVKWDEAEIGVITANTAKGLFAMGYDIAAQARRLAPYLTGALRNTIRVRETAQNTVEVVAGGTFGGYKVDYAWIREQGPNKNPATEHYMENAKDNIMSGDYITKYFGGITR